MDKDRISGAAKQIKGAVKELSGKAIGDAKLVADLQGAFEGLQALLRLGHCPRQPYPRHLVVWFQPQRFLDGRRRFEVDAHLSGGIPQGWGKDPRQRGGDESGPSYARHR